MAKKVRVELSKNLDGIMFDPGVKAELRRRAEAILARARASAPVLTGRYRDDLHVSEVDSGDRAAVRIGSKAPHAHLVEARTGNLARALDAGGGS